MERAALAIAEHGRKGEDPLLPRGQQLLAGKLRRGVEVKRPPRVLRPDQLRREGMQVRLVAGRHLQGAGLDLDEPLRREPIPHGRHDTPARQQERPPVGMDVGGPTRGSAA